MPEIIQHIKAARKVYELYWESYLRGDVEPFASVLDEKLELIGTSESEIAHSKSEGLVLLEAQMHEVVGNVEKRNRKVKSVVIGDLILINELCDIYFRNKQEWNFYSRLRLSTLLRETSEGWKVLQQHGSLPDHKVEGDETIALEKISKENIELRDAVKRRTAELENKNRELAVEAALEKVRSSALAMKEPPDMVDVCTVISDQLQLMGIRDIRNVQTAIINEQKGTYLNYQYFAAYNEGVIEETDYNKHPTVHAMVQEMKKSVNSTFKGSMAGKELSTFREWRKQNNQFPDPLLDEVESVHYYFYSIGQGGLGLSTYKPLSEEGHEIFKRFHNVFTLAYRRFTDIELALAQAREAQIEVALERIRSRALAMHNSTEVGDVSDLLFSELEKMDINPTGFSIMVFDREQDKYELWRAKEVAHQGVYETFSIKAMYDKLDQYIPGFTEELESRWNGGSPFFIAELSGKRRISFIEANREMGKYTEAQFENVLRIYPDPIFWHLIFFKHGWLGLVQNELLLADSLLVIRRFAEVFEFAYTRFLDLQKAEAQAREAQIELSLERVRAQVTAMQESSELLDIVVTMRTEFVGLGHEAHYFWYMRWLPDKYEKAMTSGDGTRIGMVMSLPRHIHGDIKLVADWEKSDEPSVVLAMDVDTAVVYVDKMITLGDFEIVDPQAPTLDDIRHIGGLTFVMARTTHGEIGYSLPGTVPNPPSAALDTLVRFAGVFDLAYKRFEDLKAAERQTRMIREERDRLEIALKELKATQTQLVQQEKLASLGQLTAGIAHEIKNPLNFVNNFSEVSIELIEEALDEIRQIEGNAHATETAEILADIKSNLGKIHEHGTRANDIVTSMLQHSRGGSGKMEPTDLNDLVKEYTKLCFHGMRAGKNPINLDIQMLLDKNLDKVPLIKEDFSRVIINLCNNAFDAMRSKLNNEAPGAYTPQLILKTIRNEKTVQLMIKDNGPGIPDDIKDKILQPFFTTKKGTEGTGLGLSITHDIVKVHGGELMVNTKMQEYTEFIIQLPV